jgi:hypothetical protein
LFFFLYVLHHASSAGVDAVGPEEPGEPFDFRCPEGSIITQYHGYVGPLAAGNNYIVGLGPVECSDGSSSSSLWGKKGSGAGPGTPFNEGPFGKGCHGFDVAFDDSAGGPTLDTLDFTKCGGNVQGGYKPPSGIQRASLRCPSGMPVVGVFGMFGSTNVTPGGWEYPFRIGLYCM